MINLHAIACQSSANKLATVAVSVNTNIIESTTLLGGLQCALFLILVALVAKKKEVVSLEPYYVDHT